MSAPYTDCSCNIPTNEGHRKITWLRARSWWSYPVMFLMTFVNLTVLHKALYRTQLIQSQYALLYLKWPEQNWPLDTSYNFIWATCAFFVLLFFWFVSIVLYLVFVCLFALLYKLTKIDAWVHGLPPKTWAMVLNDQYEVIHSKKKSMFAWDRFFCDLPAAMNQKTICYALALSTVMYFLCILYFPITLSFMPQPLFTNFFQTESHGIAHKGL